MRARTPAPRRIDLSDEALARIASFEAIPRMDMTKLAEALGTTPRNAWGVYDDLRRRGAVRSVTVVDPTKVLGACECRASIRLDCRAPELIEAVEESLARDLQIATAVRVTGTWDYLVRAYHSSEAVADAWFRGLLALPGVVDGELKFCRTIFERHTYAAAILAAER